MGKWRDSTVTSKRASKQLSVMVRTGGIHCKNFLLSYRTTPHAVTGVAPAELLFGQQVCDKIPCLPKTVNKRKADRKAKVKDQLHDTL